MRFEINQRINQVNYFSIRKMVCIPCFIIPVLLYVWHKFIQPYILRFWNPWQKKDAQGNDIPPEKTEFPIDCTGGKCVFRGKTQKNDSTADETHEKEKLIAHPKNE